MIDVSQTLGHEIVQEMASVREQLGSLHGINPAASNPSLATAGPHTGTGVSNATTAPHESTHTQPSIRTSSVQSPDGPYLVGIDEYIWDPQNPANDISASNAANWLKNGVRGGVPGTKPTDIATFDPGNGLIQDGNGNSDIKWDINRTFSTMHVGGVGVYTGQQTIQSGITVELTGANTLNLSLDMPNASSSLNLDFASSSSQFQVDSNATITDMDFSGNNLAQFIVSGGTTTMAQAPGFTEELGVTFKIKSGGLVNYQNNNRLQLTQNNLSIIVLGEMDLYFGNQNQNTLIGGGAANPNDYINVQGGVLAYFGRANIVDTITVPVYVNNSGRFAVTVNTEEKPLAGKLIVQGGNASTQNVSVYLNSGGLVTLDHYDTFECDNDFNAVNGLLETLDNSTCTLQAGAGAVGQGTVTIGVSSAIIIDQPNIGYGTLQVNAANLNLNGSLVLAIDAQNPPTCGLLSVTGTTNLQATNSTLKIYDNNGPPPAGQGPWIIIKDGVGNNITGDFVKPITTVPQANLTAQVDQNNPNQYILKS